MSKKGRSVSCPQDSFYTEPILTACGTIANYEQCDSSTNPPCCPNGYEYVSNVDECTLNGSVPGRQYMCQPTQPQITTQTKIDCCTGNIPIGSSFSSHCASGYCQNSTECQLFFADHCLNSITNAGQTKPECSLFCQNNPSVCAASNNTNYYPTEATPFCQTNPETNRLQKQIIWVLAICVLLLVLNLIFVVPRLSKLNETRAPTFSSFTKQR